MALAQIGMFTTTAEALATAIGVIFGYVGGLATLFLVVVDLILRYH